MKRVRALAWAAIGFACAGAALAQTFPTRPIKLVVPYAPGGTSDFVGRAIAGRLGELLGQPVVVENKPGGNEIIGTEFVAKAAPDGYTLLLVTPSFTSNPALQPRLPYDSLKDFAPVALIASYPHVLVASTASVPLDSVQDVIALAKANPGRLNYASGGSGGSNHLAAEMFKSLTTVQITHVPYKGNGPAIADLLAGRVQLLFTGMAPVEQQIKAGKLRALAVTGPKRLAAWPDVPTMTEAGVPGYDLVSWYGVLAPFGTPKAIVDRLNTELRRTMQTTEVRDKFVASLGADTTVGTPDQFRDMLRGEFVTWAKLVQTMNIKVD
ncbi:MAG: tripartite tricarboxylate transporter substrate binding protein [Burkholderiales bacterium]